MRDSNIAPENVGSLLYGTQNKDPLLSETLNPKPLLVPLQIPLRYPLLLETLNLYRAL